MMSVQNYLKYAHAAKKERRGPEAAKEKYMINNNISGCGWCCLSSIKLAVHVINSSGFEYIFLEFHCIRV